VHRWGVNPIAISGHFCDSRRAKSVKIQDFCQFTAQSCLIAPMTGIAVARLKSTK